MRVDLSEDYVVQSFLRQQLLFVVTQPAAFVKIKDYPTHVGWSAHTRVVGWTP
jgi:hypothetical protein